MSASIIRIIALVAGIVASAAAMQIRELTLISPVTGKRFTAVATPLSQSATHSEGVLADMGSDDDGCRHSSTVGEYERYIVTDPTSYFTALAVEWDDRSGRFTQPLGGEFKDWLVRQFNAEQKADFIRAFDRAKQIAQVQGQLPPDREQFIMPQDAVPVEKRFMLAVECYRARGARPAVLAKVALTGAWALRTRAQIPIADPRLAGGLQEVNALVQKQIKDGEDFAVSKWHGIYRDIFDTKRLTPTAYFVAGQVLYGFELRKGDLAACGKITDLLTERFKPNQDNSDGFEFHRGLVRSMTRMEATYRGLLDTASQEFRKAIAQEEFTRNRLVEPVLAVAECLRRAGRTRDALDWYLCLAQLPETQPKLRDDIRAEGKVPAVSAPYLVQLGWIADRHIAELKKVHPDHPGKPAGADSQLINAIVFGGLGTLDFVNPDWKPATGATEADCAFVIDLIGKGVLLYNERLGEYPAELGELWSRDIVYDRNRVNRFHCPVTGSPFRYIQPKGPLAARTILVAGSAPIDTKDGKRYPAFLANNVIVWAEEAPNPGDIWMR